MATDNVELVKINKNERFDIFVCALRKNGVIVTEISKDNSCFKKYVIKKNEYEIELNCVIKNICGSGWTDKPYVKRIQIAALNTTDDIKNVNNIVYLFIGIARVNSKYVYVSWNPLYYTFHKKNRSCYVLDSSIIDGFNNGLVVSNDLNNRVIVSDDENVYKLIEKFMEINSVKL